MARSHGRIMSAIWDDPEFVRLDADAQRMYMFLVSQSDLNHAGLLPMRLRRWATKVHGATPESIRETLATLEEHHFIIADDDTEEVLVRTFVRNDGVYKQPKVMLRMREDAQQITSPRLRGTFRAELDRLPTSELTTTRQQIEGIISDLRSDFSDAGYPSGRVPDTLREPFPVDNSDDSGENSETAGQNPSDRVSDTHSEGYAIPTRVRAGALPQPPSPNPQPPTTVPPSAGEVALRDDDSPGTAQTLVAEWIDHCDQPPPGRVKGQVAKEIKTMLDEGIDYDRVRHGLAEWNQRDVHPSVLPSIVHGIGNAQSKSRRQRETDDMFDAAMQRAQNAERNVS